MDAAYKRAVEELFWDWYDDVVAEIYRKEDLQSHNDLARARAARLGIFIPAGRLDELL